MEVLITGDSISYGWGVDRQYQSYVALLKNKLEESHGAVAICNRGIPGDTVLDGLARAEKDLTQLNPNYIIINFGTNDGLPSLFAGEIRVSLEIFKEKLKELIAYFQGNSPAQIFLLTTVAAWEERIRESLILYNQAIKEVGQETGVAVVDIYHSLTEAGKEKTVLADGLHPSAFGHKIIFQEIYRALEDK